MSSDWSSQMELYMSLEKCELFRGQVERMRQSRDDAELKRIFSLPRLTFGTAGIRGQMGPGFGQMNDLVIIQTSQGLVSYLLEKYGSELCHKRGVIIGHDARHNSARFARLVALAFLQKSIPVYFVNHIIPTPLIAHGVTYFNCHCGIVITASHNPKQDNGYKVYWANGAQIQSPHDRNIQGHIMRAENLRPWNDNYSWTHEYLSPPATENLGSLKQQQQQQQAKQLPEQMGGILYQVYDELCKSYYAYLQRSLVRDLQGGGGGGLSSNELRITYTTMHGVGHEFLTRALQLAGFNSCHPVESQAQPNPEFPTVKFPNPEEAGALELAFETAARTCSSLILANDPDADRCAAALYWPATKRRRPLSGNEIGSLLGWWAWHKYQQQQHTSTSSTSKPHQSSPDDEMQRSRVARGSIKSTQTTATLGYYDTFEDDDINDDELATDKTPATPITKPIIGAGCVQSQPTVQVRKATSTTTTTTTSVAKTAPPASVKWKPEDCYMISTAVSSRFLDSMARVEKFSFIETLTGFKYMGNVAHDLLKRGKQVLFAYEEAIGYMVDAQILDKDGISAAVQLAQCAAYLANSCNRTLEDQLEWLYERYGYHFSLNSYYICHEPAVIQKIFHQLQSNYPKSFRSSSQEDEEFLVTRVRDLNNGIDNGTPDHKPDLPVSSASFMVTFWINQEIRFTIRTSGTEPKIKFYSEIVDLKNDQAGAQARLQRFVKAAVERCLQPEVFKLKPASA